MDKSLDRRAFLKQGAAAAAVTMAGFVMGCESETSSDPKIMKENLETLKSFIESMEHFQSASLSKEKPDTVMVHEQFLSIHFSKLKYNEIAEKLNKRNDSGGLIVLFEIRDRDREAAKVSTNNSLASRSAYVPKLK